ncbi:hypothetical protein F5B22DRAFT_620349 [Xylaria bambusicola]|uniref:uncharacterized protein n=1 Tax=Xylaria bambusicola TaxID=326684 RepID=UPI002008610F|nr:uncharacterized protein F5B22DRAFT_620349 [Xylaria bambusicola]KAI0508579.1 hypothetical protein F5B22DRAFT_620349 [Xylaria bambusicola]
MPCGADMNLFTSLPLSSSVFSEWLDGSVPQHPYFDDNAKIQSIVSNIKHRLMSFAIEACHLVLEEIPCEQPQHNVLSQTLSAKPSLWWAVLLAQRYGVIYFMSRGEAQSTYYQLIRKHAVETDIIDNFLRSNAAGVRIINYAVHAYITRGDLHVEYSTFCVPPNAIAAVGPNHVVVRKGDFINRPSSEVLASHSPMWDLHDFAHLSSATLDETLYGNKYQACLVQLPKRLTALIRSPGMRTATGPKISDGLVFSELLTKMYTDAVADISKNAKQTYKSLCTDLANMLAEYYLAKRGLEHPSTGQTMMLRQPILPIELAVLVQNKSYELPASEIEQRVLTRGGAQATTEDALLPLTARERITWLAKSRNWGYFEVRNTIKHRAHKEAYRIVCEELMTQTTDEFEKALLQKTNANILYKDWKAGHRLILWDELPQM